MILYKKVLPLQSFKLKRMAGRRDYDIAFVGLKPGAHEFNFDLDDQFFADFGVEDMKNAHIKVKMILEKQTGFFVIKFDVDGKTQVSCDRCGNPLGINLWDEFNVIVKMVDNPEEMNNNEEDPDVFYISRTESHLHIKNWLYEFAMLSIPNQNMCNEDEIGGPQCNQEVLKKLNDMKSANQDQNAGNLWKGLDQFRGN